MTEPGRGGCLTSLSGCSTVVFESGRGRLDGQVVVGGVVRILW